MTCGLQVWVLKSGVNCGHPLMSCWCSPLQVAVVTYSEAVGQGQRVLLATVLTETSARIWGQSGERGEVKGHWAVIQSFPVSLPSVSGAFLQFQPLVPSTISWILVLSELWPHRSGLNNTSLPLDSLWSLLTSWLSETHFPIQGRDKENGFLWNAFIKSCLFFLKKPIYVFPA